MSDSIRDAFQRAKTDVDQLRAQINLLTTEVKELKAIIASTTIQQTNQHIGRPIPTGHSINPTEELNELHNRAQEGLISPFKPISIGNRGVPTNQPTIQQTNQHIGNRGVGVNTNFDPTRKNRFSHTTDEISHLANVAEILASLDGLKKEVRIKFKRLTTQEMAVFAKIYELDEAGFEVTYDLISQALRLTEISIRDYIRKIIAKGIPVDKRKENNKRIILSISGDLKQIASLETIIQLREL